MKLELDLHDKLLLTFILSEELRQLGESAKIFKGSKVAVEYITDRLDRTTKILERLRELEE
nr:MAG TPA_asm: hypothetical protein [Caudoviricetes sp.]